MLVLQSQDLLQFFYVYVSHGNVWRCNYVQTVTFGDAGRTKGQGCSCLMKGTRNLIRSIGLNMSEQLWRISHLR